MNEKLDWFRALPFWLAFRLIALSLVRRMFRIPVTFSFSQGAEDIILPYIATYHFSMTEPGMYVDVGCNAPVRCSNTFELYLRGWRGINIDANKDLINECKRVRKQDISICAAVSDTERNVVFHKADGGLMSTIDEDKFGEWKDLAVFAGENQEHVTTRTLTSILDDNWQFKEKFDLLTIDVEGHDLQVLTSLDLDKYRPKIIVIETHELNGIRESEIYRFLTVNGYQLLHFAVLNAYFVDQKSSQK